MFVRVFQITRRKIETIKAAKNINGCWKDMAGKLDNIGQVLYKNKFHLHFGCQAKVLTFSNISASLFIC